jgi:hypothetical protein
MSRVYFHSQHGEAELWGGERAWLGRLCSKLALGILDVQHSWENVERLIRPDSYLKRPMGQHLSWVNSVETAISLGWNDEKLFQWRGRPISMWELCLNTAARVGNDAVRLAARIHGQCEIHCYVEGVNRWWLADVIDDGLESGVLRRLAPFFENAKSDQGQWESVTRLLRDRDDEPVVLSYSVCEQFPNRDFAGWNPLQQASIDGDSQDDDADELWYELSDGERWRIALQALRRSGGGRELKPADWGTFWFGNGLTALDLLAKDWENRLDRALEVT